MRCTTGLRILWPSGAALWPGSRRPRNARGKAGNTARSVCRAGAHASALGRWRTEPEVSTRALLGSAGGEVAASLVTSVYR